MWLSVPSETLDCISYQDTRRSTQSLALTNATFNMYQQQPLVTQMRENRMILYLLHPDWCFWLCSNHYSYNKKPRKKTSIATEINVFLCLPLVCRWPSWRLLSPAGLFIFQLIAIILFFLCYDINYFLILNLSLGVETWVTFSKSQFMFFFFFFYVNKSLRGWESWQNTKHTCSLFSATCA